VSYTHRACGAWTPQTGVRVTGNRLSDIGGDGIAVHHTSGALVEHNTLAGFQRRAPQCSAGVWGWNTLDNTFQYNEMSGGHGTCDAQGMDLDEGNIGTVYQYNYSHDNDGGFVLLCNGAGSTTTRNVFRYNISRNDGGQIFDFVCGKITDTEVYGNYVYVSRPSQIVYNGNGSTGENVGFRDNVFYVADAGASYEAGSLSFTHNTFYGLRAAGEPADPQKVTAGDSAGVRLPAGRSLDVPANSTTAGTALQLWDWHGRPNQRWTVLDQGERGSLIVNAGSGLCLDVDGNSTASGAAIIQWTCQGDDNQRWTAGTGPAGATLTSDRSGLLLTADADTGGAAVTQRPAGPTARQTWTVG
ncbi:RICIN domain-containing protein, partial [Streptomyces sp. NRRL WC-3549]|uniref:RICIN domain-containing protein n=1 Tax=Streptomyces sp. NRRL WC-3549 TaxID=1463925 RepID=UPI0018FE2AF3